MLKMRNLVFGLIAALLMTLAACDTVATNNPDVDTEASVWGCPEFLPDADYPITASNGIEYTADSRGRPEAATIDLGEAGPAKRDNRCQSKVGNWFEGSGAHPNYEGGHLIGSQLGGWGKRLNLVPQWGNFNGGNWAQMENAAALCERADAISMEARVFYEDDSTPLVPTSFNAIFLDFENPSDQIVGRFDNKAEGGPNGRQQRIDIVNWLEDHGCT